MDIKELLAKHAGKGESPSGTEGAMGEGHDESESHEDALCDAMFDAIKRDDRAGFRSACKDYMAFCMNDAPDSEPGEASEEEAEGEPPKKKHAAVILGLG